MFPKNVYENRRKSLANMTDGILLFPGNNEVPMNYRANVYPFRQDSSFLYYFGADNPGLAAIIDTDTGESTLYGDDLSLEDIIWTGEHDNLEVIAGKTGIEHTKPAGKLASDMKMFIDIKRKVHYLPPYIEGRRLQLARLLGLKYESADAGASRSLIKAVAGQRSVKDEHELEEMEITMSEVTREAYDEISDLIREGITEAEIAGAFEGSILKKGCRPAYSVICTVRGEILHSTSYGNRLQKGQLLLMDAGAESPLHYATDITRTYPVSGVFTTEQKDIYDLVLKAQMAAIAAISPGVPYRDIHFIAAKIVAEGLKALGLMKGNTDDAIREGAHAMFFPHGIGHMIGLDVHDMEDLGEKFVGYDDEFSRSDQFGTAYLRMAKRLREGNVVTVEPGIYFIKPLIDQWQKEKKSADFLNYDLIRKFTGFGGIRIEDNVVVTKDGFRIIGKPIPK